MNSQGKGIDQNKEETTESKEQMPNSWTTYRVQQHRRIVCCFGVSVFLAWVLGKLDFGIYWFFSLFVFTVVWLRCKNATIQELVFKEAELEAHRARAFKNDETVEWLNFLMNRW